MNVWYNSDASDAIGMYPVLWESVGGPLGISWGALSVNKLCGINRCRKFLGCKKSTMGAQKGCTDADALWRYLGYEKAAIGHYDVGLNFGQKSDAL